MIGKLLSILVLLSLSLGNQTAVHATGVPPPLPGICSESDRFGVWAVGRRIDSYDVGRLHAGWYTTWTVEEEPPHPAGMTLVQLVRISADGPEADAACSGCPTWDEVRTIAQLNPGSLWLIGNEPDRQDYVHADRYAELYHDFYTFLKAEDPTCQLAIGGVVQPTPIRLQYLDMILDAYESLYGELMPVDVWNTHNYVLRERRWNPGCLDCWGCDIPPGIPIDSGMLYNVEDHDNLDYWTGHLTSMRQWMRDRGYRDRPLIVSEFGILMPEFYGYDYARVRDFMLATFEWMRTASDDDIGYPADGNRLVQAWAWYNLDDPILEGFPLLNHLFDPDTKALTALGTDFGTYTSFLTAPFEGTVDLQPLAIGQIGPPAGDGEPITTTVRAVVFNAGASEAQDVKVWFQRDGEPAGKITIPEIAAGASETASVLWSNLDRQPYLVRVDVNPDGQIAECNHLNNDLTTTLVMGEYWVFLPRVQRED